MSKRSMSLIAKMGILTSFVTAAVVFFGIFTVSAIGDQGQVLSKIYNNEFQYYSKITTIEVSLKDIHNQVLLLQSKYLVNGITLEQSLPQLQQIVAKIEHVRTQNLELQEFAFKGTSLFDSADKLDPKYADSSANSKEMQTFIESYTALLDYRNFINLWADDFKASGAESAAFFFDSAIFAYEISNKSYDTLRELVSEKLGGAYESSQSKLEQTTQLAYFIMIFAILSTIIGVSLFALSIGRRIKLIVPALDKASRGDLTFVIPPIGSDELGRIAHMLNTMKDCQRTMIQGIKTASDQSMEISQTFSLISQESANSTAEMSSTTTSISKKMDELNNNIKSFNEMSSKNASYIEIVMNLIQSFSTSLQQIFASIEQVSSTVAQISSSAESKYETFHSLIKTTDEGSRSVDVTKRLITNTSKAFKEIGDIIQIIEDIASKTHVLGINAAIQASQTGVQGKRFSVVAKEIQTLSDNTDASAKSIGSKIHTINHEFKLLEEHFSITTNSFEQIRGHSHDVNSAFEGISKSIHEVSIGTQEISKTLKALVDQTNKVNHETESIITVTNDFANEINTLSSFSHDINIAITQLEADITALNQSSDAIKIKSENGRLNSIELKNSVASFII